MSNLRKREFILSLTFLFLLLATTVVLLVVVEQCARLLTPISIARPIFPAYSQVSYRTREFNAVAKTNRFGFRGEEADIVSGQIVAIGDSFTFGWGLNLEDTWPYKLERRLSSNSSSTKVYNLGQPGAAPDDYLRTARSYVPALKPKIVLVSLLQGDDLAQLLVKHRFQDSSNFSVRSFLKDHFYGVLSVIRGVSRSDQPISATEGWGELAREIIDRKHLHVPSDLEEWAISGNLNPGLLSSAAEFPRQLVAPYEAVNVGALKKEIANILREISTMTQEGGGTVVLFSMPNSPYFQTRFRETFRRLGFEIPDLDYCDMDRFVADVSHDLGIRYIEITKQLRQASNLDEVWYPFDGHPNATGTDLISKLVFEALLRPNESGRGVVCE
jgi:hypothetical protein